MSQLHHYGADIPTDGSSSKRLTLYITHSLQSSL